MRGRRPRTSPMSTSLRTDPRPTARYDPSRDTKRLSPETTSGRAARRFDGPQRAIRCAMAICMQWLPLGIEVRAGLHTGECEVRGDRRTHDLKGVPGEWRLFAV